MSSLGSYLREFRVRRGASLEEVARATRIPGRYLEALEADDLGSLPAPTFTRGFIRAYCQVLQVPVDEALALYHRQTGTLPPVTPPAGVESRPDLAARSRGTVLVSFVLLVVLGLALVAVTLALQSGREGGHPRPAQLAGERGPAPESTIPDQDLAPAPRVSEPGRPQPPAAPPAPSRAVPPSSTAPHSSTAPQSSAAPGPSPATAQVGPETTSPYRLVARVTEPTWVRVRMDDGRASEETIPAGEVREWTSNTPFVLTVGNAGGITLELNGRPLPPLGARGMVISRLVVPSRPQ
jgi:cytoskeleton protein RodZ